MEKARSISHECKLPLFLWSEAVFTANYLINISPTSANSEITPKQIYLGKIPSVDHLKIFGSLAYVHISKEDRTKLDSKTKRCLFVGYDDQTKAYRLYDSTKRKIILNRDIVYRVGYHHIIHTSDPSNEPELFPQLPELDPDYSAIETPNLPQSETAEIQPDPQSPIEFPIDNSQNPETSSLNPESLAKRLSPRRIPTGTEPSEKRYPTRNRAPSTRLKDFWTMVSEIMEEPISYSDAIKNEG
jgi:hypothetical protein